LNDYFTTWQYRIKVASAFDPEKMQSKSETPDGYISIEIWHKGGNTAPQSAWQTNFHRVTKC